VDGRGVPLSIIVTGANRHDLSQLAAVLDGIVVQRPEPSERRSKHLCADGGYTGALALGIIEEHGYIPHVKGRGQEAKEKRQHPTKRARRWIVEVAHSWFNRFRKLPCGMRNSNAASSDSTIWQGRSSRAGKSN
jgi:transposase